MYCLNLLGIALELAKKDPVYEDIATKFFEHFVYIGAAINKVGGHKGGLWDAEDGYYYDVLRLPDGRCFPIKAQTISGLIPIFAVAVGDREGVASFGDFAERLRWFAKYRPELLRGLGDMTRRGVDDRIRLAIVDTTSCGASSGPVLDSEGMLSPHGVRSVSKHHHEHPFVLALNGNQFALDYAPAESTTRALRRQLELARTGLVPAQLPADRGAAEARRLPRRDIQGRVPHGLRAPR